MPKPDDLPPLLTTAQLAEWLTGQGIAVTRETIRDWCLEKKIPATRTPGGKEWRIRREDAQAIVTPAPR
jgi:excisionase family DNA binding protein